MPLEKVPAILLVGYGDTHFCDSPNALDAKE